MALVLAVSGGAVPARASLVLSFDSPSYAIANIGGTATVNVYVSQVAGGPSVGATNPLFTGGIELTFATAGAAIETSFTASPAWDSSSAGTAPSGPNTIVSLTTLSVSGIANLTQPLLLGTFTFTGESLGSTTVTLSTITPGVNFIDLNGDDLDPTNKPTASIQVGPSVVPEPNSLALLALAGASALAGLVRLRQSPRLT
jgi:hypothetical protein